MPSSNIRVEGLDELMKSLKGLDKELRKGVRREIRQIARPVLDDARSYALGIARTGAYAHSLAMRAIDGGVRIQSSDPGAGVIEFANPGAFYLSGPRMGKRIGVPSGGPPRALVRSVDDNEAQVVSDMESYVASIVDRFIR